MDFVASIAFLVLYYIRPQEWIPGVGVLRPVTLVMGVALWATFTRKGGFNFKEVLKTPHDWLMLAYFLWIVGTARNPFAALGALYNLFVFYVVTVLALSNPERIQKYLWWWAALILTLAALAVASEYGFDPMGSRDITHGAMQGRLSLGTGLFNNPNGLGHSVGPVLLLLYFLLVWNRLIFVAATSIPGYALSVYCIYLTASKGSFLSAAATATVALCFGRPKLVQIGIVITALSVGAVGLKQLPRMASMDNTKSDEGIQRRLIAFQFGYRAMRDNLTGLGYGTFVDRIASVWRQKSASPHSSYVHVGAEFGRPGFFLFCGILYACYRTLLAARTTSTEEERVRRLLFALLLSFTISSWMIDWSVRAYFFLIVAATASFHRYLVQKEKVLATEKAKAGGATASQAALAPEPPDSAWRRPRLGRVGDGTRATFAARKRQETLPEGATRPFWNQLRLADFAMIGGVTFLTMMFWRYVMMNV
jgi:O-antigen ligase